MHSRVVSVACETIDCSKKRAPAYCHRHPHYCQPCLLPSLLPPKVPEVAGKLVRPTERESRVSSPTPRLPVSTQRTLLHYLSKRYDSSISYSTPTAVPPRAQRSHLTWPFRTWSGVSCHVVDIARRSSRAALALTATRKPSASLAMDVSLYVPDAGLVPRDVAYLV